MAKTKIVFRMSMESEKRRQRALSLAVQVHGVESTSINRDKGELTVSGEDVDAVEVTKLLRSGKPRFMCLGAILPANGMGSVELVSVGEDKKEEKKKPDSEMGIQWCYSHHGVRPQYQLVEVEQEREIRGCWGW